MRVAYEIKEPTTTPDQVPVNHDVGIILMNAAGASSHEDTGREAQDLADGLGLVVIAADRPTSHAPWLDRELYEQLSDKDDGPVHAMDSLGQKLDEEIERFGFKKIRFASRSAGATGALELALTERISAADSMYLAEPAGFQDVPDNSKQEYKDRLRHQTDLEKVDEAQAQQLGGELQLIYPFKDYASLPRWRQTYRIATMIPLTIFDVNYNKNHYNRDIIPDYLGRVVFDLGLDTYVDLAQYSMVTPNDVNLNDLATERLELLKLASNGRFDYGIVPDTIHRSFDRRPFFAQRVVETAGNGLTV